MSNRIITLLFLFTFSIFVSNLFAQADQDNAKDSTVQIKEEPVKDVTVPTGTKFNIIISNQLATNRNFKGSTFSANLAADLKVDTIVVSPKNSLVIGKIVESKRGQGLGDAELSIQINEITVNKELVPVVTEPIIVKGERKRNAEAEIPAGTIEEVLLKSPLVIK